MKNSKSELGTSLAMLGIMSGVGLMMTKILGDKVINMFDKNAKPELVEAQFKGMAHGIITGVSEIYEKRMEEYKDRIDELEDATYRLEEALDKKNVDVEGLMKEIEKLNKKIVKKSQKSKIKPKKAPVKKPMKAVEEMIPEDEKGKEEEVKEEYY